MDSPILIINVKTYEEASGEHAVELAQACKKIQDSTNKNIALSVQAADIHQVKEIGIPVLAQHIDNITPGSHTGFILAEDVKQAGAQGTLLNHSEHRLERNILEESIKRARENDLTVVLCAKDADEAKDLASLNPDFIAVEPPELIGGDISVSTANPELIKDSVNKIKDVNSNIRVLVGAGVKNANDVKIAKELGADGVLVASGVVKSYNWIEVIEDLVKEL